VEVALWYLRAALDDKADPPIRGDAELTGQLSADRGLLRALIAPYTVSIYYRPWETAARLIEQGADYEVGGELQSRTDRKIASLRRTQTLKDAEYGYAGVTGPDGLVADVSGLRVTWGE